MQLTENFSLEECIHSGAAERLGLDNTPNPQQLKNIIFTCEQMELVRAALRAVHPGATCHVDSCFRSGPVNHAVGGATNSAHLLGLAMDAKFFSPEGRIGNIEAAKIIAGTKIPFQKIILEYGPYGWVHCEFTLPPAVGQRILETKRSAASPYVLGLVE